jgi:hypothetical protein
MDNDLHSQWDHRGTRPGITPLSQKASEEQAPVRTLPLPTGTVTFLFTHIEGSTKLLQQLGAAGRRGGVRAGAR